MESILCYRLKLKVRMLTGTTPSSSSYLLHWRSGILVQSISRLRTGTCRAFVQRCHTRLQGRRRRRLERLRWSCLPKHWIELSATWKKRWKWKLLQLIWNPDRLLSPALEFKSESLTSFWTSSFISLYSGCNKLLQTVSLYWKSILQDFLSNISFTLTSSRLPENEIRNMAGSMVMLLRMSFNLAAVREF